MRMKKMITIATIAVFGGFAQAEEGAKDCPKSKTVKAPCDAGQPNMIKLAVTGLDKEDSAEATQKRLKMTAGVTECGACSKSGTIVVSFVPEIVDVADIEKVVADAGFKVAGHKTSMKVTGLNCKLCSDKLTKVLEGTNGIVVVNKACKKSGMLEVTYDASKINAKKIKAAVNATNYKVVEGAANENCKKACDKKAATPQS